MADIDIRDRIAKIAKLANIGVEEKSVELLVKKANAVISFIDQLQELDTSSVEPMLHAVDFNGSLREDSAKIFADTEGILANAPTRVGPFINVPKVIDGD